MKAACTQGRYTVRGLDLAYHAWGDPKDTPLLCLHGFMDHGLSYSFFVEALPEGYFVVAPDMRGHGHSGWVGAGGYYHFYDYFDDMRTLLDHLQWSEFGVLGHSMGGSVATGLTAMMPERVHALVLMEGMGPPFAEVNGLPGRLARWSAALDKPAFVGDVAHRRRARKVLADHDEAAQRLRRVNPRLTAERAQRLAHTFTEPAEGAQGVVWRQDPLHRTPSAKPYLRSEAESLWAQITCPVLSLQGAESVWLPEDLTERHAALKDVTSGQVPGAGHNLHHDQPQVIAEATHAWVRHAPEALPSAIVRAASP